MSDKTDAELVAEVDAGLIDCPSCGQRPRWRGIRPVISCDPEVDGPTCDDSWHDARPEVALTELESRLTAANATIDALKAEHEAAKQYNTSLNAESGGYPILDAYAEMMTAHDHAEEVLRHE